MISLFYYQKLRLPDHLINVSHHQHHHRRDFLPNSREKSLKFSSEFFSFLHLSEINHEIWRNYRVIQTACIFIFSVKITVAPTKKSRARVGGYRLAREPVGSNLVGKDKIALLGGAARLRRRVIPSITELNQCFKIHILDPNLDISTFEK